MPYVSSHVSRRCKMKLRAGGKLEEDEIEAS